MALDNRAGFLGFVSHVLGLDEVPDYEAVVASGFRTLSLRHNYSGDQIRFLRAVQDVFLAKRGLAEADLYEPPSRISAATPSSGFLPRRKSRKSWR